MNDQGIEVFNTSDCMNLKHLNTSPTTPRLVFISQKFIKVVATLNASHGAVLIISQPLDLNLDMLD